MPSIDIVVSSNLDRTARVRQLEGMFEIPAKEKLTHRWLGDVPIDDRDWNVGLIVGPSGSGKSQVMKRLFGDPPLFYWRAASVVDDFDNRKSIEDVARACSAVGFNTIPSWLKPYRVLSNGEQFRATLARHLIETPDPIVIDEFTSVVDRQVAKIVSHATQKYIRKVKRQFVAVSCHSDIIDWLQPDWILEPVTMTFRWRAVQRRPAINIEIARVDKSAWKAFSPFHYMTSEMHSAVTCFGLWADSVLTTFAAVLHRPHPRCRDIKGVSRLVTLPDYQGLGLGMVMMDRLGEVYKAANFRLHAYPAHPSFVRSFDSSPRWTMRKRPGLLQRAPSKSTTLASMAMSRPCAVFSYEGAACADIALSRSIIAANDVE